jgi:twinkle protein
MENTDSTFLYHSACDECGSSDANSVYDDGHTYCFSCNTHKQGEKEMQTNVKEKCKDFIKETLTLIQHKNLTIKQVHGLEDHVKLQTTMIKINN